MPNCTKRYTDPSSLRKHVKSHSLEEQRQCKLKKDTPTPTQCPSMSTSLPWATAATPRQSGTDTPTSNSFNMGMSSSTLLSVGLQAGGTVMNVVEDTPSPAVGGGGSLGAAAADVVSSPLQQIILSGTLGADDNDGGVANKRGKTIVFTK